MLKRHKKLVGKEQENESIACPDNSFSSRNVNPRLMARMLPIVSYLGTMYFQDDRLQQIREVHNPHNFKSFGEIDWTQVFIKDREDIGGYPAGEPLGERKSNL